MIEQKQLNPPSKHKSPLMEGGCPTGRAGFPFLTGEGRNCHIFYWGDK